MDFLFRFPSTASVRRVICAQKNGPNLNVTTIKKSPYPKDIVHMHQGWVHACFLPAGCKKVHRTSAAWSSTIPNTLLFCLHLYLKHLEQRTMHLCDFRVVCKTRRTHIVYSYTFESGLHIYPRRESQSTHSSFCLFRSLDFFFRCLSHYTLHWIVGTLPKCLFILLSLRTALLQPVVGVYARASVTWSLQRIGSEVTVKFPGRI